MSSQPSQRVSQPEVHSSDAVLTMATVFFLASELSLFRAYFARNWPLLSPAHGFVTLAVAMVVLGVNVLGNLNKPATSEESLGLAMWRVVISSGILAFVLGFFNFFSVRFILHRPRSTMQ